MNVSRAVLLVLILWLDGVVGRTPCDVALNLEATEETIQKDLLSLSNEIRDLRQDVQKLSIAQETGVTEDDIRRQKSEYNALKSRLGRLLHQANENQAKYHDLVLRKNENSRRIQNLRDTLEKLRNMCMGEIQINCPNQLTGKDCAEIFVKGGRRNGVYFIQPSGDFTPFPAYCDQETEGGGWTYIHSHVNDDLDFNRSWLSYKHGFGDVSCDSLSNFWIGNEAMHVMTSSRFYHLRVNVMDWSNNEGYATYTTFQVGPEDTHYRLRIDGYVQATHPDMRIGNGFMGYDFGHADDVLYTTHNNMKFSTFDNDNDMYKHGNCANQDGGGWWFNQCSAVNLNGRVYSDGFYKAADTLYGFDNAMIWGPWTGLWYSLKMSSMKIRPASFIDDT